MRDTHIERSLVSSKYRFIVQDPQQAPEFTGTTRGTFINRANELGRSIRPQSQKSSMHRWKIHHKVQTILAQYGRKPVRVLSAEDVEEIRHQQMLGFLGPSTSRFGSRSRFQIRSFSQPQFFDFSLYMLDTRLYILVFRFWFFELLVLSCSFNFHSLLLQSSCIRSTPL